MILLAIEDGLFDWAWQHMPHILFVVILMIATAWITAHFMILYHRFILTEHRCDDLRNKYIPDIYKKINAIENRLNAIEIRINILEDKLNALVVSVGKISMYIITEKGLGTNVFVADSPIELAKTGLEILDACGGKQYIENNLFHLIRAIEDRAPKSALDVQHYAHAVLTERSADDAFTVIKDYVFQNPVHFVTPARRFILDIDTIVQIMAINLRNRYLETHRFLKLIG